MMPAEAKQIIETGNEPEYYVEDIARVEPLGGGMVRLYIASERHNSLRIEYTIVLRKEKLADIGRMCLCIAADTHNNDLLWMETEGAH
jgi:hypothetical protein